MAMERGNGLKERQSMDVTFLLSTFYKIYILKSQKACLLSAVKELETTASMRQMKTFQSEPRSPTPDSSGKLETKRAGSEK